jgi:copper resistance protein C
MTRIRLAVAVIGLTLGGLVATATAASAHAVLLATTPAEGSVVRTALSQVSLRFDEAVGEPAFLTVTGPDGRVDDGRTQVDGALVSVKLRGDAPQGRYTVAYRVISDDGHPAEGRFEYQLASGPASSTSPGTSPAPAAAAQAAPPAVAQAASGGARAAGAGGQAQGGHWLVGLSGLAVVVVGAGALLWERRRRHDAADEGPP